MVIRHGIEPFESQFNDAGYTLGEKAEHFEKISYCRRYLFIHGYLSCSENAELISRIDKKLMENIKKIDI